MSRLMPSRRFVDGGLLPDDPNYTAAINSWRAQGYDQPMAEAFVRATGANRTAPWNQPGVTPRVYSTGPTPPAAPPPSLPMAVPPPGSLPSSVPLTGSGSVGMAPPAPSAPSVAPLASASDPATAEPAVTSPGAAAARRRDKQPQGLFSNIQQPWLRALLTGGLGGLLGGASTDSTGHGFGVGALGAGTIAALLSLLMKKKQDQTSDDTTNSARGGPIKEKTMQAARAPRARKFQGGGATGGTVDPATFNPVGMNAQQLQQAAQQAASAGRGTAGANLGMMGLGINPWTGMSAGMSPGGPAPAGAPTDPWGNTVGGTPMTQDQMQAVVAKRLAAQGGGGGGQQSFAMPPGLTSRFGPPTPVGMGAGPAGPPPAPSLSGLGGSVGGPPPAGSVGGPGASPGGPPVSGMGPLSATPPGGGGPPMGPPPGMGAMGPMGAPGAAGPMASMAALGGGGGGLGLPPQLGGTGGISMPPAASPAGSAGLNNLRAGLGGRSPMRPYRKGGKVDGDMAADGDTIAKKRRPDRQWGDTANDPNNEVLKKGGAIAKAKGGSIKRPKVPKVSIAVVSKKPQVSTPNPYDYEGPGGTPVTGAAPPVATPAAAPDGMKGGGKFIQKAIKNPGALHEDLGVPEDKNIPAKKMAKAAKAPGKLGKRARLAQTLKKLHKSKGGKCKMAAGGAAKERRGFPNTNPPPKRLAKGGKVRGCGAATKGCTFSGIF